METTEERSVPKPNIRLLDYIGVRPGNREKPDPAPLLIAAEETVLGTDFP